MGHEKAYLKCMINVRLYSFSEMPTNRYVDSSFWCFDSLFVPQQHPARDAQDTFFLKDPAVDTKFPQDVMKRVAEMHTKGGAGSIGYVSDLTDSWSRLWETCFF
jgi:phenylalanyl-tRNA synthetase alpha subunit